VADKVVFYVLSKCRRERGGTDEGIKASAGLRDRVTNEIIPRLELELYLTHDFSECSWSFVDAIVSSVRHFISLIDLVFCAFSSNKVVRMTVRMKTAATIPSTTDLACNYLACSLCFRNLASISDQYRTHLLNVLKNVAVAIGFI